MGCPSRLSRKSNGIAAAMALAARQRGAQFVDNFSQAFSSVVVSLGAQSITVQGIGESRYGADEAATEPPTTPGMTASSDRAVHFCARPRGVRRWPAGQSSTNVA